MAWRNRSTLFFMSVAALATTVARGELTLPALITDHMVLQREARVPLWGWAPPGATVRVTTGWDKQSASRQADASGRWEVRVNTPSAGGPYQITIALDGSSARRVIRDVLIGEVWLCSGQSNMAWNFHGGILNAEQEVAAADYANIRLFQVELTFAGEPRRDCTGQWAACTPATVRGFSATAYFFGRALHRQLGVPIGLIHSSWGGTVAEAWTSAEALRTLGDFDARLALLGELENTPTLARKKAAEARKTYWRTVNAADPGWGSRQADFDDRHWPVMGVPGFWSSSEALTDFDGIVWFRRTFEFPADAPVGAYELHLGAIDDQDETWINGRRIGAHLEAGKYNTPRRYRVPADVLHPGTNVVVVRVLDTGLEGGFAGPADAIKLVRTKGEPGVAIGLAGSWRYQIGPALSRMPASPPPVEMHRNDPSVLYNGMIAPLVPYGMRGVIWYQGESNRARAEQYRELFPTMIADWRNRWGQGNFPFYYVQIAPFAYKHDRGQAAELRDAQRLTLATPHTGMVVTLDIGDPHNIHPANKQAVGERLARWARSRVYGDTDLVCSGPLYRGLRVENGTLRLEFDAVQGGLIFGPEGGRHFEVAGADGAFKTAEARIDGNTLVLASPQVAQPTAARYAWGAADEASLFNRAGLPASSFDTRNGPTPRGYLDTDR
jgi:sialate O-acetylesterase